MFPADVKPSGGEREVMRVGEEDGSVWISGLLRARPHRTQEQSLSSALHLLHLLIPSCFGPSRRLLGLPPYGSGGRAEVSQSRASTVEAGWLVNSSPADSASRWAPRDPSAKAFGAQLIPIIPCSWAASPDLNVNRQSRAEIMSPSM